MGCQINNIKTTIDKNDNEMAFLEVSDSEASMDCVIFANEWNEIYKTGLCCLDNLVLISGDRSRTSGNFIIKKMWQLT
jgi:DNA polymerase III alpha subunit